MQLKNDSKSTISNSITLNNYTHTYLRQEIQDITSLELHLSTQIGYRELQIVINNLMIQFVP